ncbi:MAG: hypothetical protein KDD50_10375, partial [Bdellovibrionales bacterium]|nr:hypothetical protein [Bdellovibrionales bacterium]
GRELVANDFIYAWKRLADPQNKSDGFWIFDGKIKGLDKWRDNLSNNKGKFEDPIGGLRAVDDHTLQIKLEKPYFQLLYVLAMTYSAPTAKEAVDKYGKEYLNHPVGTGPYKLEKWVRGSKLTLVKNENWAGETYPTEGEEQDKSNGLLEDAGKKLPFADKIVFHVIIEDQPLWLNFMKGNIDMLGIPKDNFDSSVKNGELTADMRDKGIRLQITSEPDVTYIAFNMEDPVLGKNENLRKALSLAYHSRAVIKKFYNDRAVSANSPIPPDIEGYDADFKNPYKTHDVEKAKEYLKKAGFPGGKGLPAFEYITTSSATARQMSEQFKESMAQIGVNIKIATSSWPQFLEKIKNKKAQMFGMAWLADYPDAENFLQLLYGKNISPGPNGSNFKNKEFDKLYEKASLLPPGAEREKLYKEMRDIVVEKAPWIPGAHRLGFYTYQGWLHNFKRHSIISDYFKYLRVDLKEKQELKKKL